LWFGTEDGRLCAFGQGYSDLTFEELGAGLVTVDEDLECFYYAKTIPFAIENGEMLHIYGSNIYTVLLPHAEYRADQGRFFAKSVDDILKVYEGTKLLMDRVEGTDFSLGSDTVLTVADVDVGDGSFLLLRDGVPLTATVDATCRLCMRHAEGIFYVCDVDREESRFSICDKYGKKMDIAVYDYAGEFVFMEMRVIKEQPVVAQMMTGVSDLGSDIYAKRLTGISILLDPNVNGRVKFGYTSRFGGGMLTAFGADDPFSFRHFAFSDFTFDTGFTRSYYSSVFERNVNFLALRVSSEEATPCAILSLAAECIFTKKNKGVV
jgi:hypothetical protein